MKFQFKKIIEKSVFIIRIRQKLLQLMLGISPRLNSICAIYYAVNKNYYQKTRQKKTNKRQLKYKPKFHVIVLYRTEDTNSRISIKQITQTREANP